MIIFWLAQTSNVTPPIALAAFAGAGIAGASPMKSAFSAFKLANGLFLIPLMMAYSSLLFVWELLSDVALSAVCTLVIMLLIAISFGGFWGKPFTAVPADTSRESGAAVDLAITLYSTCRFLGLCHFYFGFQRAFLPTSLCRLVID